MTSPFKILIGGGAMSGLIGERRGRRGERRGGRGEMRGGGGERSA